MELGGLLDEFERYAKNSYIANIKLGVPDIRDFLQEFFTRRTFFIHMSHEIDYESLSSQLPAHIQLAYDGLAIPFQLEH